MKKRRLLLIGITVLVLMSLLISFGCSESTPTPSPTPTPTSSPTSTTGLPPTSTSTAAPSQPAVIKWKAQTSYGMTEAPYGPFALGETGMWGVPNLWLQWVQKRFNGRLVIDVANVGTIFPPAESDTAIKNKVVDLTFTYGGYYTGRIPESDFEQGLFFWESSAEQYEADYKYGLAKVLGKVYAKNGIVRFPMYTDAICGIMATFPLDKLENVKGKKLRTTGLLAEVVGLAEGSPVNLPLADTYMALKLGTIDGALGGLANLESLKWREVTKSILISPNLSNAGGSILINPGSFNALPEDMRNAFINEAPIAAYAASTNWHNQCLWNAQNASKLGVRVYRWSAEDTASIIKLAQEKSYPKLAARSPESAEAMAIVLKQMKDYGKIN